MTLDLHEASAVELADWDRRTVDLPGGHVYQSMAWADFQRTQGWRTRQLAFDDGRGVLALERRWPLLGGRSGSAYLSRGPVPGGESPERTAERLVAAAAWLAGRGIDVVAGDPEVGAATGYGQRLLEAGFHPIADIQPSRHRLRVPLVGRSVDEVLAGVTKSTRQRIRHADQSGIEVLRADARLAPPGGTERAALDEFYDLLVATGDRRGFTFGSRAEFVGWWDAALRAGHLVYLSAHSPRADVADADPASAAIAGLVLYRHGGRLSTVHSADRAETRRDYPGALHLLRWRAIELAIAEECVEMDLGGVDVPGARRIPRADEAMFGLYEHKRSFGAEWVELSSPYELVARPMRSRIGRLTSRLAREVRRRRPVRTDHGAGTAESEAQGHSAALAGATAIASATIGPGARA